MHRIHVGFLKPWSFLSSVGYRISDYITCERKSRREQGLFTSLFVSVVTVSRSRRHKQVWQVSAASIVFWSCQCDNLLFFILLTLISHLLSSIALHFWHSNSFVCRWKTVVLFLRSTIFRHTVLKGSRDPMGGIEKCLKAIDQWKLVELVTKRTISDEVRFWK